MADPYLKQLLKETLRTVVEASVDTGVADDSSAANHLDDSAKNWPVDTFVNLIVEITGGTGEGQIRKIASNTATSLVPVTNFAITPDSTSTYRIGFFGKMAFDITAWGGTALTGRDISLDLKALTDDSIKGLLKSIGDIATLENLVTRIGQTSDAIVAAGATGSIAAKLRRVTQGLEDLKSLIVLAAGTNIIGKIRMVTATGDEITDDTADAVKAILQAATAVIGKVRLVTAAGDEITDDTADAIKSILQAGTNIIGKVGIDQTTPGTTDRVTGNIDKWAGTALTGRDISGDLAKIESILAKLTPIEKASEHNTAETANTDILGSALSPTNTPCLFRVMVAFDTAGAFKATVTKAADTQTVIFNAGANLAANAVYIFDHLVHSGDTINYQYSVNAQLLVFRVQEIVGGVQ